MLTYDELIEHFAMIRHPEGGAFIESYRSPLAIDPPTFPGERSSSTAIYFLLGKSDFSAFHRIRSDELWHFYLGGPLEIIEISPAGQLKITTLGSDIFGGHKLQHTVPAGHWFASQPTDGSPYALVGCTVAPGFDFEDFELADRTLLIADFPHLHETIRRLTR